MGESGDSINSRTDSYRDSTSSAYTSLLKFYQYLDHDLIVRSAKRKTFYCFLKSGEIA